MTPSRFLSDEWFAQVRAIKTSLTGNPIDVDGMVVNATITGVPFGEPTRELHSEHGPVVGWEPGHHESPVISLTIDYELARQFVLDQTSSTLAQAADAGALQIVGDRAAFDAWWRRRIGNPAAVAVEDQVRAITV